MKYRKKAEACIEAVQFDGTLECVDRIIEMCGCSIEGLALKFKDVSLTIKVNNKHTIRLDKNDYLIRDTCGNISQCSEPVFTNTFEVIGQADIFNKLP